MLKERGTTFGNISEPGNFNTSRRITFGERTGTKTVLDEMSAFHEPLKANIIQCCICFEAWQVKLKSVSKKNLVDYKCTRRLRDKWYRKKFSRESMMIPYPVPTEMQELSQRQGMLIHRAFPVMQVYMKPRYGIISYKGHVVTLPHNVPKIAGILPNLPSELPVVVFQARDRDNKNFNFKVRRNFVLKALYWLLKHNVLCKNVVINMKRVNQLPEDDYLDVCSV